MSKKTSQNGYKSDSTDTTSSNSDLDKCEKTSNTNFLFSEFQKHESTTSRKFQRHGNGSKIKKVSDNETNQIFTSETSLNEDLYGTSDKYNDTLQKLKSKLHSLHLDLPTNNKINTTGNLCCEEHYKDEDFRFDINFKISNFLFDKETNTSTTNFRKKPSLDTIYKENKQESSYLPADTQIHVSKAIEEMDEQTNPDANISTSAFSSMEILSILEPVEMRSTSTWCSSPQDCASPLLYVNQSTSRIKNKIQNVYSNSESEKYYVNFNKILNDSSSIKSTRTSIPQLKEDGKRTSSYPMQTKTQEDYIPRRHFVVDLPSSVEGDYTSSDNFTVTPSIITLDNDKKSKRLYKKRNKVAPSPQSASSSSASLSNDSKRLKQLLLRYLNDTPLISSNSTSTPPPILSTQASGSATETTVKSKVDLLSNVSTNTMNSSTIYSSQQLNQSLEVFNPTYSSSLDVLKQQSKILEFPAISKITSFINYPEVELRMLNIENISECSKFSSLARKIKTEICTSNTTIKEQKHTSVTDDLNNRTEVENIYVPKLNAVRNQSDELSFYAISSTDSGNHEHDCKTNQCELESNFQSEDERLPKCGCFCNWFFPRKRNRYFY